MYRLLRERGQSGERRAQAAHPAKKKPEADGLWPGPGMVLGHHETERACPGNVVPAVCHYLSPGKSFTGRPGRLRTGPSAKEFIEHAIEANGGSAPQAVHADRGTSMTSNTVAGLYARLGIDQTHSRPHVSNDNPYSEAQLQDPQVLPGVPRRIRVHRRRQRILPRLPGTTIMSTGIPGSRCTPQRRCTTDLGRHRSPPRRHP